jgi:3-oxoadipate enol-lactonase
VISHHLVRPWGRFAYLRAEGAGNPLVLIHPLATGARLWEPFHAEFGPRDIIAIDLRGCGDSGWDGQPYAIADLAGDLLALLDALGIDTADIAGMSMGGCVAMAFAAAHPARARRLALCDTTAWYGPGASQAWEDRATGAETRPRQELIPFQTQRWFNEAFCRDHPEEVQRIVDLFVHTPAPAHAAACRSLGAFDARPVVGAITAATLVLTGEEDYAAPPEMGEALARAIPGAVFKLWHSVRHFAVLESRDLRAFIARHLNG